MTVPGLVLEQARRQPDAVAVRQWDQRVSYAALTAAAGGLAATLAGLGAGPETRVAVCARRTPATVAGLLGILLTGAAYVPIDPDLPRRRALDQLADAAPVAVVADRAGAALLGDAGRPVVAVPEFGAGGPPPDAGPARPDGAAYVLYTSGSTGRPKGVVVSHRSVVAYCRSVGEWSGIVAADRALAFAALSFDVSVHDLFVPLAAGAEVDLVPDADRIDPARLQAFAEEHRPTWGGLPVSVLALVDPDRLPDWRVVITGAETVAPEQVARWDGGGRRRFLYCYGATETTISTVVFEAAGTWTEPLPIGRALPGQRTHVVDGRLRPVPAGEPGELLIGGAGVARGYLDRAALTAERFVPDPFGEPGGRLYRTGDLVRARPDGALMFLGRIDRQVKVRGQRVEIGEVEAGLRSHPDVADAAVDATTGHTGTELTAFVTPLAGAGEADLLAHCAERLPAAMVPTRAVRVPRLPLTTSGKVDLTALRAACPAPEPAGPTAALDHPVAAIWRRVLDTASAGPDDDFFTAGGHSVTAMRLVASVRAELGRDLAVEDVFAARTLAAVAARVDAAAHLDGADVPTGRPPALSAAQRRLWFVDQLARDASAYNIALAERITGPLDAPALGAALRAVAERHDVLRWRVRSEAGEPYVVLDPSTDVPLPVQEVTAESLPAALDREAVGRFDLATGPLWRARLLRLGPREHVLAITAHHAVFDGWSVAPLYADLSAGYAAVTAGRSPAPAGQPVRFGDYVAWRADRDRRRSGADAAWWKEHLAGVPTVLDLPRDAQRPEVQTYAGRLERVRLPEPTDAAVRELAARLGATPPSVLLAGFGVLLHRLTGGTDLIVGTPAADRRLAAFHDLIGFFIDIVPLRLRIDPERDFADLVGAARDEVLGVLAHPATPLEDLVTTAGAPRDPGRAPLVQVLFNAYTFPEPRLRLAGAGSAPVLAGLPGSPFDLTAYLIERDGRYVVDFVYNTDLYSAGRMRATLAAYVDLLGALATAPDEPVGSAPMAALPPGVVDPPPTPRPVVPVAAGTGATERLIARAWCDALGRARIGPDDNFFDIGGTSMALVSVQAALAGHPDLTGREPRVVDLFRFPTVRSLAGFLDTAPTGGGGRATGLAAAANRGTRRTRPRRKPDRPARQTRREDTTP